VSVNTDGVNTLETPLNPVRHLVIGALSDRENRSCRPAGPAHTGRSHQPGDRYGRYSSHSRTGRAAHRNLSFLVWSCS